MAQRLVVDGRNVWLKRYRDTERRVGRHCLNLVARLLGVDALKLPDRGPAEQARATEARRLRELAAAGVTVPEVVGEGRSVLLLSDIGNSLAAEMGRVRSDARQLGKLVDGAVQSIAEVHAHGNYIGQPLPRNMTLDGQRYGFIDFEEDPGEVMPLETAQAHDWLLFVSGAVRRMDPPAESDLVRMLRSTLEREGRGVIDCLHHASSRLRFLEMVATPFGERARALGRAVKVLRAATHAIPYAFLLVLTDFLSDGDLDLLHLPLLFP